MAPIYNRLPFDDSIRLLKIDKAPAEDGSLECSLSETRLSVEPCYTAVSYTWRLSPAHAETGDTLHTVKCNGHEMQVYENLYYALVRFSNSAFVDKPLWIDYLCIDQLEHDERNQQVNIMWRIYKSAERVIIWLGPEHSSLEMAVLLIEELCRLTKEEFAGLHPADLSPVSAGTMCDNRYSFLQCWQALAQFFCRPWFSRAWTIQEVLLAKRIHVLCGKHELLWDNLVRVSDFLATSIWTKALRNAEFTGLHGAHVHHNGPTTLAAVRGGSEASNGDRLLYTLIRSRRFKCKEDHDKIYSLLGLSKARAPPETEFPRPNYNLSVAQVYLDTAIWILRNSDHLLLLAYPEGQCFRKVQGLPTWVPDWSVSSHMGLGMTGYHRFSAANQRQRRIDFLAENRVIAIEAAQLDTIEAAGETKHEVERTHCFPQWLEIVSRLPSLYMGEPRMKSFWRTLLVGTPKERDPTQDLNSLFRKWLMHAAAVNCRNPTDAGRQMLDMLSQLLESDGTELIPSEIEIQEHAAYLASYNYSPLEHSSLFDAIFCHAPCLRLFTSARGFIGLGTESLKPRDTLWIVSGSRVPLIFRQNVTDTVTPSHVPNTSEKGNNRPILRKCKNVNEAFTEEAERSSRALRERGKGMTPTTEIMTEGSPSSRYELVGATYLHGFMHGEALAEKYRLKFGTVELK